MTVDWWLIVVIVVMCFLILGAVFYVMVLYSSPEDKNQAWFPKIVVIFGGSLACFTVLLLPLDVANRADPTKLASLGGGLDLALVWQICLIATVVMAIVVIPFAIFYYEGVDADEGNILTQACPAIFYTLLLVIVFVGITVGLWFGIGNTDIPYISYEAPMQNVTLPFVPLLANATTTAALPSLPTAIAIAAQIDAACSICSKDTLHLKIKVSLAIYAIAVLCLLGWICLVLFGGVGLATLPIDLILDWVHRPVPLTAVEFAQLKDRIGRKVTRLIEKGKDIENSQLRSRGIGMMLRRRINEFKQDVLKTEEEMEKLKVAYKEGGGSPLIHWAKLLIGIVGIALSLAWATHVIINNLLKVHPLLNYMFVRLDRVFALFGTAAYGLFTIYLLWAVAKGVIKVGSHALVFEVYPMKLGDTLMNAMLFNCVLVLTASVTVTQFAAMSFRSYAANTAVDSMFTTYISNLQYIGYVFRYFQYGFLAFALISLILAVVCSRRKDPNEEYRAILAANSVN
eukprot:TRINITY_DN6249_c0_g1_i1.p1 TRINITY_DN6249_c0_g1~~TRINITY_DN6249_c0_g1_i1.p1  ORF type:complete len:513 (+),score=151.80 TRINITY_DN6249_c0_g1_i1:117-1655(+)